MDHSWLGTALLSCLRVGTAWGLYSDLVWGLCQLGFLSTLLATQMECYTLHLRLWNEKRNLWFFIEPCVLPSLFVTSKGDYYWNKKAMETLFKRILSRTTKNSKSLNILVILKALFKVGIIYGFWWLNYHEIKLGTIRLTTILELMILGLTIYLNRFKLSEVCNQVVIAQWLAPR